MEAKINLDCKTKHVKKDGSFPLLLRVAYNGEQIYINIGMSIQERFYDKDKKKVIDIKGASTYTNHIEKHKGKIQDIFNEYERKGKVVNLYKIREEYFFELGKVDSVCFYDYVKEKIAEEKKLKLLKEKTLYNYEREMEILQEYSPKLSIHDIDKSFLEKYESYLLTTLLRSRNSKFHAMTCIRKYTLQLFTAGEIKNYPFSNYSVGSPEIGEPLYLETEELIRLHDLYDSGELLNIVRTADSKYTKYKTFPLGVKYQEVLKYYLASCYCGLRHSDIKTLSVNEIQNGTIVKEMKKGRKGVLKTVRIPVRKRFLSLLDLKSNHFAFGVKVKENSQTNKYLKAIAEIAGINKNLTFHSSRHTFAINSLLLGIPIEVISNILGHSEIKTTQRYARVVDSLKNQEMNKWDKIAKKDSISYSDAVVITCPNCEYNLFSLEKNMLRINKIPCVCSICDTEFLFDLNKKVKEASIQ
jgi:integrase